MSDSLVVKRGNVFLTSPRDGELPLGERHPYGLWYRDCRFLSGHELRVNAERPLLLQASDAGGDRALHDLTDSLRLVSVRVERQVRADGVLRERISVANHRSEPLALELSLRLAADFEPMLVLRGLVERPAPPPVAVDASPGALLFATVGRDGVERATSVSVRPPATEVCGATLRWEAELGAECVYEVVVEVAVSEDGAGPQVAAAPAVQGMRVSSDEELFDRVLGRSLADLELLQSELSGCSFYAAGVPWYATLFGRDALISALQMLAFAPEVAAGTLRLLAALQGSVDDPVRAEQPGRILHELRVGEPAALDETPFARYYGSADGTPLWLCLLVEHSDWSGSLELFRELRPQVDAALGWIEREADPLISYAPGPGGGLVNQGWRDSRDGVPDEAGAPLEAPVALVEVQGYAIRALRGTARLLELDGEAQAAERLRARADALGLELDRFWLPDVGSYAIGLDGAGRPGSGLTSNPGHLLWARAVDGDRARGVRDALLGRSLFSGWGVRTLAEGHPGYNPIGYHTGSVWPHDNALIAAGLREYEFDAEFSRVFEGVLEAASRLADHRLPELFGGQERRSDETPVPYPVACRPQAWAAGAIPQLLTTGLGLRAAGLERRLHVDRPLLPPWVGTITLSGLRVADAVVDLRFERAAPDAARATLVDARVEGDLELVVDGRVSAG